MGVACSQAVLENEQGSRPFALGDSRWVGGLVGGMGWDGELVFSILIPTMTLQGHLSHIVCLHHLARFAACSLSKNCTLSIRIIRTSIRTAVVRAWCVKQVSFSCQVRTCHQPRVANIRSSEAEQSRNRSQYVRRVQQHTHCQPPRPTWAVLGFIQLLMECFSNGRLTAT